MTKLPLEDRRVVGTSGPSYVPAAVCFHPFCSETYGLEKHHVWRRSFLGGGFNWVELPDGKVVANLVHLCQEHHQMVTENKAKIEWADMMGVQHFRWIDGDVAFYGAGTPLVPQPPKAVDDFPEEDVAPTADDAGESLTEPSEGVFPIPKGWELHIRRAPHEGEECQLCKRRVPKKRKPTTPTSKVHSFRGPLDQSDQMEEIWEAVAKHLGVYEKAHWKHEAVLRAFVIALQEPGEE